MITITNNILDLGQDCQLVSCQFDTQQFSSTSLQEVEQTWDIAVPLKIQNAVDKRKAEFIAGRYCAKLALKALDPGNTLIADSEIDIGDKRQPIWPPGYIGSITHSHGFAAAAMANNAKVRGLGIDSEHRINESTANNVSKHILTETESFADNDTIVDTAENYLTLIFSAKESIFKCLYPLVLQYFDFRDAVITLSPTKSNHFEFTLLKNLNEEFCSGYHGNGIYNFDGEFAHTAVTITTS